MSHSSGTLSILWHDVLDSTQETAHQLAIEGAPHGTVVAARAQRAGRGTRGRPWESPRGGLWLSVICRCQDAAPPDAMSLRIGLAVAETLESLVPRAPGIQIKWPNDLHIRDRKVGGILCEARWRGPRLDWVTVGVGVNVCNEIPDLLRRSAVGLVEFDPDVSPEHLVGPVAQCVARVAASPFHLAARELDSFGQRNWLQGREITSPFRGIAEGIRNDGALLVREPSGQITAVCYGTVSAPLATTPRRD